MRLWRKRFASARFATQRMGREVVGRAVMGVDMGVGVRGFRCKLATKRYCIYKNKI